MLTYIFVIVGLVVIGHFGRKAMERPSGLGLEPGETKLGEMFVRTKDIALGGFIISGSANEGKLILTNKKLRYGRFDEKKIALSLEPSDIISISAEAGQKGTLLKFLQVKAPALIATYLDKTRSVEKTVTWTVPAQVSVSGLIGSTTYPNPHTADSFLALVNDWRR
jgi:hypothetical protein